MLPAMTRGGRTPLETVPLKAPALKKTALSRTAPEGRIPGRVMARAVDPAVMTPVVMDPAVIARGTRSETEGRMKANTTKGWATGCDLLALPFFLSLIALGPL